MIAWVLLIAVVIVALFGWLSFWGAQGVVRQVARQAQNMHAGDERTMAFDRELILFVLRRELANYLVNHDPDRYLRLYREARATELTLNKAERTVQETELKKITDKYPMYESFDFVGSREYVLYGDTLGDYGIFHPSH
jgi:hypothetical protein